MNLPGGRVIRNSKLILFPVWGIILFLVCYIVAAIQYPGGSAFDPHEPGFSIINNYWCNLMNKEAINGEINKGRAFAFAGMVFLCVSLAIFWWVFPQHTKLKKGLRQLIRICGLISMCIPVFLISVLPHDELINLASFFGLVAVGGTLAGLKKEGWTFLFYFGVFNLVLVALNNFLYYSEDLISALPLVQKISFLSFLLWFICICIRTGKEKKTSTVT